MNVFTKPRLVSVLTNPGLQSGVSDDVINEDFSPSATSGIKAGLVIS
jgi:hypothetical protein